MIRFFTAGESHGPGLTGVIEGLPAGLELGGEDLASDMARRKMGYGRGGRMAIETDTVRFVSGVRKGRTLGGPVTVWIENRDFKNWEQVMGADPAPEDGVRAVHVPRPGHADLVGGVKYGHRDLRNVLERASARETATRVALGAVARKYLALFGVKVSSCVLSIGAVSFPGPSEELWNDPATLRERTLNSEVFCPDPDTSSRMVEEIRSAKKAGDTLGGVFEVRATGLPVGLGSYSQWDQRLDGRLAQALLSIQAIKGVEIGLGFEAARLPGSRVHDPILRKGEGLVRSSNGSGGLEGGVTNGSPLVVRAAMKPIATLYTPLPSVDLRTGEESPASVERSDICAVPAASVVGEAMVCLILAQAFSDKIGGDSVEEVMAHFQASCHLERERLHPWETA
ncbi:MAG: chorismate synthase [Nitrospiraceae bacterium]|nr:chorismate synthase [Nitrospiraceae bacterium]